MLNILRRCEALGVYDLAKTEGFGNVKKARDQIDSLERALAVAIVLLAAVLILVPLAALRIRRRRRKRLEAKQMPVEADTPPHAAGSPANDETGRDGR